MQFDPRRLLGLKWGRARRILKKNHQNYRVVCTEGFEDRWYLSSTEKVFWVRPARGEEGNVVEVLLAFPKCESRSVRRAKCKDNTSE